MTGNQRYREIAQEFIEKLPPEYIQHVISNTNYVLPFEKPVPKCPAGWGLSSERVTYIENIAIQCRNIYQTCRLRTELIKLINKSGK